jgi:hypothetical protein
LLGQATAATLDTNPLASWSDKSCPCSGAWKGITCEGGSVNKV